MIGQFLIELSILNWSDEFETLELESMRRCRVLLPLGFLIEILFHSSNEVTEV